MKINARAPRTFPGIRCSPRDRGRNARRDRSLSLHRDPNPEELPMQSLAIRLLSGAALAVLATTQAPAAGAQTATVTKITVIEPATVMKGYRATKIIGTTVVNEANETVGKIDDLVIRADDKVVVAIVSVGGFLGIGDHLVAVPYESIQWRENTGVLPGATKERLKAFPEFTYAARQ